MKQQEMENYRKAGKIAKEAVEYAKSIIKPNLTLLEIAEKIESKIQSLGGNLAFPVNLSMNDIAAHYTPSYNDETKASGLLKIDIGVHIKGCIADTAFSIDLDNSKDNKNLIKASEESLKNAIKVLKKNVEICKIGKAIDETISSYSYSSIKNLSGHSLNLYDLHSGISIPNFDNKSDIPLETGAYAIEPFATTGNGAIYEGRPSGIYKLNDEKVPRDMNARKILSYILENYSTLPFAKRWLIKEFGMKASLALNFLEKEEIVYQFPQLIEVTHKNVSQAEHTVLISDKIEIITE